MKMIRYDYPRLLNGAESLMGAPGWGLGEFSQLFERMGRGDLFGDASPLATDIYEDDHHYYARFEFPGVKKEELRVELEGDVLTVSSEKKSDEASGASRRAIRLPEGVDSEQIAAKLEDGVLTVSLGKAEAVKPKKIEIS